ncbi:Mpv17 PMP22 domain containing protein [Asbolus verrucosus]|uniref:Mitochondrial inner membrane protein Mpv17 n=1 Tax=Asbolus verrucosus TaxID=1661398 RepID=A0A482W1U0_ASBVE|nr:Mpv17 PMP22 domain containing protein [Asbolus verrucosus]
MTSILKLYKTFLFRHPYLSQSLQTGLLMGAGDIIAQTVVEKQPLKELNYKRTIQFFSVGTFFVGPALTVWYGVLHKYVGSGGKSVALKKVALDQVCFAPVCLVAVLGCIKTLQGNTFEQTKREIKNTYCDILIANYKLWPMVQVVNFYFVPLHYQVLLVQIVALLWNTYLSYKTRPTKVD